MQIFPPTEFKFTFPLNVLNIEQICLQINRINKTPIMMYFKGNHHMSYFPYRNLKAYLLLYVSVKNIWRHCLNFASAVLLHKASQQTSSCVYRLLQNKTNLVLFFYDFLSKTIYFWHFILWHRADRNYTFLKFHFSVSCKKVHIFLLHFLCFTVFPTT